MVRGKGGRAPAPVRKPVVGVGGGEAFGLVRNLEELLPRAVAVGVLEQQQPALLPCVAAAVARGSGCSAKPRQRRRAGAFRTLGYARPIVQIAPERSRAMVRRILSTADRQGAEEVAHRKAHLRASARPDLKRWGHRGAPKGHMSGVQRGPTVPPSPYRLGSVQSWGSISAAPAGRVDR